MIRTTNAAGRQAAGAAMGSAGAAMRPAAAAMLAIFAAACGGADDAPEPIDERISTEVVQEDFTDADYGELDPAQVGLTIPWKRGPVSKEHGGGENVRLTEVSTASSPGFDRVTFSFSPRLPLYSVELSAQARTGCGDSGPFADDSPAHLVVEFSGARSNDGGTPLVADRDRSPAFPSLATAVQTCDEGDKVRWLLGLAGETDYRIMEVGGDPRFVVDLRHPPPT